MNSFIRGVQEKLVGLGYAVAVPDYYHGNGPAEPDNYDDFTEVKEHIGRLDFTRGARDLAATVDAVRAMPGIDPRRVAVWGYCTGANPRLAGRVPARRPGGGGAVLSEPAGIRGTEPARPVHPVDLLWQLTCPALFLYGDQDKLMPPALLADMRARIDYWKVDAQVNVYSGAGHSFTCPRGPMRNAEADRAAWNDAITFLSEQMGA